MSQSSLSLYRYLLGSGEQNSLSRSKPGLNTFCHPPPSLFESHHGSARGKRYWQDRRDWISVNFNRGLYLSCATLVYDTRPQSQVVKTHAQRKDGPVSSRCNARIDATHSAIHGCNLVQWVGKPTTATGDMTDYISVCVLCCVCDIPHMRHTPPPPPQSPSIPQRRALAYEATPTRRDGTETRPCHRDAPRSCPSGRAAKRYY